MKMSILLCVCATVALAAYAEKPPFDFRKKPKDEAELQARKDYMARKMLEKHGDNLLRQGSQQGEIVIVDCQKSADRKWLNDRAQYFAKETRFKVLISEGEFELNSPKIKGNLSLFVVDNESLAPILIAPESRWAMVNLSQLKTQNVSVFEARVKKEVIRGLAILCGCFNSQYPNSILCGVTKPDDLDKNPELRLQVDIFQRMLLYAAAFGVTPAKFATYRRACQEGWAPNPTNDIQRNIWNEVHAIPSNPMKIEFDPATQKGKVTR